MIACDSVEALSKTSAKRVMIRGEVELKNLSGVCGLQKIEDGSSFLYAGDINELIHFLSGSNIRDLTVAEPDLEEIFMHYYTKRGEEDDNGKA